MWPSFLRIFTTFSVALPLAFATPAQPVDMSPVPFDPPASALPEGWEHGAFMEIFVRAYQDSDGDGTGDLKGLASRLDYLKDLGVKGLWLMPIQPNADGDHGYATTEYRGIAPEYGTLADFDELIAQAHARGIGVVMDYVINHSAAQHPLFLQASKGRDNRWRDWYVWRTDAPPGWNIWDAYPWYDAATKPWLSKQEPKHMPRPAAGATNLYFATFGPHMPDFNLRNPEVVDYHLASLRFWLNRGLDGYRLDAVPHMIENDAEHWNDQPESRALTRRLQQENTRYPHRYVVCEATAEPAAYGDPAVCGGAFAFGYVQHFVEAARGQAESVQRLASHYRQASPTMATFLSNHDIFTGGRLWDQLGGDLARYRVAAAAYLLQPGTPFIYFGEEIGQAGVASLPADQPMRSPMSWTAEGGFSTGQPFRPVSPNAGRFNVADELHDPRSLHAFYKAMLGLRNSRPSIARGSFESSFADGLVLGFQRRLGSERSLVLVNYDTRAAIVTVPGLSPQDRLAPLYPKAAEAPTSNTLTLAPQSVQVFDIR